MREVRVIADAIVSPLGDTTEANFSHLVVGASGVNPHALAGASPVMAAHMPALVAEEDLTRFETLCWRAMKNILDRFALPSQTLFILSTTKGNIQLLENGTPDNAKLDLHATAKLLARKAGLEQSMVISNACISGVMAIAVAKRFLQAGQYDHALIVGADELSRFVVSGFQSLQALSDERCRPFDAARKGINLGEASAALLISAAPEQFPGEHLVKIGGFGLTNDANHISGPSRTGEELAHAIQQALTTSDLSAAQIDFISAHGTATPYNDEMESKAFARAGLGTVPVNSLKPFYGHTLGAAGVVETIVSIHSLLKNTLIPTLGFQTPGVSVPVNVIRETQQKPVQTFLKTASGFGGCNAAIVLQKMTI